MCTVTWWNQPDGFELFFNRDELKGRQSGLPPKILQRNGVRYISPVDGDFGGTWMFVNEYGLSACLLNNYPKDQDFVHPGPVSRGLLMNALADCRDLTELDLRLRRENLGRYRPFFIVSLKTGVSPQLWTWDGSGLVLDTEADAVMPITTSSYLSGTVITERRRHFYERIGSGESLGPEFLEKFHRTSFPARPAFSILMEREDAETVSLSRLRVDPKGAWFSYTPRDRETGRFLHTTEVTLELAAAVA